MIEGIGKIVKIFTYGVGGIFAALVIYFAIADGGFKSTNPTKDNAESQHVEAIIAVQNDVKKYLKSPDTAKFPLPSYVDHSYLGNGKFAIRGHVDSQNSFGGIVRANYSATAIKSGSGQFDWTVDDMVIQ